MGSAAGQRANRRKQTPERRPVEDGTAYWTLSFYISRAQILGHDLAMPLDPVAFGKNDSPAERHKLTEEFNLARYFVDHDSWNPSKGGRRTIDDLRGYAAFNARDRVDKASRIDAVADRTKQLRSAINPLFNDIADRSRLGRIEDQLFAVEKAGKVEFVLPDKVTWTTEGRSYAVPIDKDACRYPVHVTRFWYLHGNGAMSWHVSFDVKYRDPAFEASLAEGKVPNGLYLLSLMQKLAYPKESEVAEGKGDVRSDELFELQLCDGKPSAKPALFWSAILGWFENDKAVMSAVHDVDLRSTSLMSVCPHIAINEIPGLFCWDTRSNFFIKDEQFFRLIQPKADGELEHRRTRVRDAMFDAYPGLIPEQPMRKVTTLGKDYWQTMLAEGAGNRDGKELGGSTPVERLLYLFLAGFNQNIIDWTNQDASEVLDSLDPIYPASDDQLEEGFFIRYANPRCLITYVQRSRTLEVGNDFIGTCPYAFLIHVLAMHNERLTRDQEKLAFAVVEKVNDTLRAAEADKAAGGAMVGKLIHQAEEWINWYRMAAFEHFDRHRYFNPFRYDTERDVFDALEQLRGTSRLIAALDKAFAALDESTRDLERVRADAEADQEGKRNLSLTLVFGFVGFAGLAQVVLQIDQLKHDSGFPFSWSVVSADLWLTLGIAALLAVLVWGMTVVAYLFRR